MNNRFFNLFRREKLSREIASELDFHIAERRDQLMADGLPLDVAERQARRKLGAYALHKEDAWMNDLIGWFETLLADLRYAVRGFRNSPGFAAVAILSLALGIGANTAIFSLIDAVMLRSLPVSHPEELLKVTRGSEDYFTNPIWEALRDHQDIFSGTLAWGNTRFNVTPSGESRYLNGDFVSGGYFSTLGVIPRIGRTLTPTDDRRGCPAAAVLSYNFWLQEYGGDSGVLAKTISLEGHAYPIIGVSQAGFTGLEVGRNADIFVPICSEAIIRGQQSALDRRSTWWITIIGRPKPGVGLAQVNARLATLAPEVFAATVPGNWSGEMQAKYRRNTLTAVAAGQGVSSVRNRYSEALRAMMIAVGLVLLIACANVANLLLARSTVRQREMAVRLALGASRGRLIRQNLTESLLLSSLGAALGLVLARWGSQTLTSLLSTTGNNVALDLALDLRVLLFTTAMGTLTGVLFGLLPAWRSARVSPNAAMKTQGRGVADGSSRMRLGKALVVVQVALSMVLVAGAGLMLATFRNLSTLDPGFRAEGVLLVNMNLRRAKVPPEAVESARRQILARLRDIPGVRSASSSVLTQIGNGGWNNEIRVDDAAERPGDEGLVNFNAVSDNYFETIGTHFAAGRDVNDRDNESAPKVLLVNETFARKFFGKASPLGHMVRIAADRGTWGPSREIVGVVGDVKYRSLRADIPPTIYLPTAQSNNPNTGFPNFELRASGSPSAMIAGVKQAVAAVNPNITMEFIPLSVQVAEALTRERLLATLSVFFGALALLLAAIGLYGVISYNVERRRNEIGVRMALGAAQARVLRMVLGEASWLAFIGLGLGIAGTLAATQVVQSFLFGLQHDDPPTLAASAAMLAAVAAVAAYLPARRAARVDPMTALRDE